ncbi:LuxR family transcriptional regulator [Polaribacter pectinis]|uniref:LuxR family transcriptional regulator n=1 Tax=Polaribacter pectinis TaxID=2738844 RepID=A0A7G9LDM3_9FLAO|nr:triple tyrosine motif-containing protein [Polaribacter pectinis]QNM86722.1 LuxR family transcriptional regulator [Polaribacter pectinis]
MKKHFHTQLLALLLFFPFFKSTCQEFPPINIFTTENYGAENQNWDISQSENKFIYVANNKGLLEYNGAMWHLYPTPNQTIMRSVKVIEDKVFTGFYMDFGFWIKNKFGVLEYTSITKEQNVEMLEDEQVWSILEVDGWMLFKSLERIYLYNIDSKALKVIKAENRIEKISKVDGVIYFQEINKGVFKIENGVPKLISDDIILKENILVEIFKTEDKLLFLTQEKGFYFLSKNNIEKWKVSSENKIAGKLIYSAKKLKNGNFVLGTISNGLIFLYGNGDFNYQITQSSGLSNNTILSVFEDQENNIWLGLDNGINCVNNASPFKFFTQKNDFWGTIYTSVVYENNLYIGTNQGLFYRNVNSEKPFQFIENTQGQVWSLVVLEDTLFCGHNTGTFIIEKGKSEKINNVQGTWDIVQKDKNTLIQGNYDGLYVLKKQGLKWVLRNKIEGFNTSSRFFTLLENDKIIVNHEYKGVFKLRVDSEFRKVIKQEKDSSVSKGIHSSLVKYNNDILYTSKKGVFKYELDKNKFVKESTYSKLIPKENFTSARLVNNLSSNKLWSFTSEDIKYLIPGKLSNKPIIKSIPISENLRKAKTGFENSIQIKNNKQLIGTSKGYLIVDLKKVKEREDFNISINKVYSFPLDQEKRSVNLSNNITFHNKENNVEFFFSVPNYTKTSTTKYQYQLLGQNKDWSSPVSSNSILFENIPFGNYTFKVRAIINNKLSSNEAKFSFKIEKPWYLSNIMVVIYIVLILLLFFVWHIISRRYYKKQREKLLYRAQKELELKELESKQEIMKLNNEKLRVDIDSKSRELASSTMNIIKKNDFLNTIKTELVDGGEKNIPKVVKIIDKNLNNTDDWKMFQEAFNNADKKFLKKMKNKHPELTPNDLRLCAYLRLNLSSKEIAPLLNISPRSVEVKRYRLRKKMNLPHDSNLTNYILEI